MENWLKYHTLRAKVQGDTHTTFTISTECSERAEHIGATNDETESLHEPHNSTSVTQELRAESGTRYSKKHKFDNIYISFGFVSVGDENSPHGKYVE